MPRMWPSSEQSRSHCRAQNVMTTATAPTNACLIWFTFLIFQFNKSRHLREFFRGILFTRRGSTSFAVVTISFSVFGVSCSGRNVNEYDEENFWNQVTHSRVPFPATWWRVRRRRCWRARSRSRPPATVMVRVMVSMMSIVICVTVFGVMMAAARAAPRLIMLSRSVSVDTVERLCARWSQWSHIYANLICHLMDSNLLICWKKKQLKNLFGNYQSNRESIIMDCGRCCFWKRKSSENKCALNSNVIAE